MQRRGITHHNTDKIVLSGSEVDVGSDVTVEIEEQYLIQEIWDSIYQSRPHGLWYASGYRRADFHVDHDGAPAATLWVNASDVSHLGGQDDTRFRCPKPNASLVLMDSTGSMPPATATMEPVVVWAACPRAAVGNRIGGATRHELSQCWDAFRVVISWF